MDLINRAIKNKFQITTNDMISNQTWNDFFKLCQGKKVVIAGAGAGLNYLFNCEKICSKLDIDLIIDNNKLLFGYTIEQTSWGIYSEKYNDLKISGYDILNKYSDDEIVILITTLKDYECIIEQLNECGKHNYYVMLLMEYNLRMTGNTDNVINDKEIFDTYVQKYYDSEINKKKILLWYGEYGGHIISITRQLLSLRNDLDIVWVFNSYSHNVQIPDGVRALYSNNKKNYIYELETAKMWIWAVTDIPQYIKKKNEQVYIQVKHWSSITLKKFNLEDKSTCISKEIEDLVKYNGKIMDYIFTGSELDEESCRKGFSYNGPMIRIGSARSDILFDKNIKIQVYNKLGLKNNAHTLLYAPTFRIDNVRKNAKINYIPDLNNILKLLEDKFDNSWYILIRLHPLLKLENCDIVLSDKIINVSDYPDSQELVAACDMMITDYSSIMFEPAFVRKPVFLYAPDRHEFIEKERGLLIDYDTLPFPIAETNEQLAEKILSFDKETYVKNIDLFMEKYGVHEDGHASERAAKFISDLIDGKGI